MTQKRTPFEKGENSYSVRLFSPQGNGKKACLHYLHMSVAKIWHVPGQTETTYYVHFSLEWRNNFEKLKLWISWEKFCYIHLSFMGFITLSKAKLTYPVYKTSHLTSKFCFNFLIWPYLLMVCILFNLFQIKRWSCRIANCKCVISWVVTPPPPPQFTHGENACILRSSWTKLRFLIIMVKLHRNMLRFQ